MGRNSKRRRDEKRRRLARHVEAVARSQHRSSGQVSILGAGRETEQDTVMMLASLYGGMPDEPECYGPLLVHLDGVFECHGEGCPGGTTIYHGEDALAPCGYRGISTMHACHRCAPLAESPG